MAAQAGLRGESRALVLEMTDLAWGAGELMTLDSPEVLPWTVLAGGLLFVDELERALAICDAALAATHTHRLETAYVAARSCRSWLLYEQGRIGEAAADAQAALNAQPEEPGAYLRTAYGALASCHLQQGQLARAETALAGIEHPDVQESINLAFLLDVRAQLRFAQLRPRDALRDALAAGHLLQRDLGVDNPGVIAWRSTAALAHLALGESDPARELAAEELEHARRIGVTRVAIRDLRVLGLAERGQPGIDLLTQAVDLGGRYPDRLEHVLALLDLGAALRRANQRAAARDPLRRALERATSGGAETLAERARRELAATGLRARHAMSSGTDALTPSESRVGELAAQGLTTRQIAETLFVTPKTVEFHLRGIYRKLDISSRSELAEMMGEEASG
jgi:DNA-binding CsgD family transcriptional regulator